jgi:hypothetical protein
LLYRHKVSKILRPASAARKGSATGWAKFFLGSEKEIFTTSFSNGTLWPAEATGREILWVAQGPALRTAGGEVLRDGVTKGLILWIKIQRMALIQIVNPARSRRGPKGDLVTGPIKFIENVVN